MPNDAGNSVAPRAYAFGDFHLDADERALYRLDGSPVPLTPRVFETLLFLVENDGRILDKERVMAAVWPDTIVEENNLSQHISTLRRVFGDKAGAPRYIATVPGRGYRFVAEVKTLEEEEMTQPARPAQASAAPEVPEPPSTRMTGLPVLAIAAAAALMLIASALIFFGSRDSGSPPPPPATPALREKGIAVLPFDNLSQSAADAFLADGMQDDILTSVGKIRSLKVIARASVMDYRGARLAGKVREIGSTLGVSHVLEGSVRRVSDRVIVNVALIDTADERQVWSERYERSLTGTLSLQTELPLVIARALQATLTPAEATTAATKATSNPDAYLLYFRGHEMEFATERAENFQAAIDLYQQAIDLDSSFALARARLSICASQLCFGLAGDAWLGRARAEAFEARRLRPDLGEGHLALALYYLWGEQDNERALSELSRTAELLPNSAEVPLTEAFILKRQNRSRDRLAALQRAEALDPRNQQVLRSLLLSYRWVHDWPQAIRTLDRMQARLPYEPPERWQWARASYEFRRTADLPVLKDQMKRLNAAFSSEPPGWSNAAVYEVAMLERDYVEAARALAIATPADFEEAVLPSRPSAHSKLFREALLHVARKSDPVVTRQILESARQEQEQACSAATEHNNLSRARADLAMLYAFLGRKDEAIKEAQVAVETYPGLADTIEKNELSAALALVYAQTGETHRAVGLIQHLLSAPLDCQRGAVYNMTLADLKWSWVWDPLRGNPRFEQLLAAAEPKTIY